MLVVHLRLRGTCDASFFSSSSGHGVPVHSHGWVANTSTLTAFTTANIREVITTRVTCYSLQVCLLSCLRENSPDRWLRQA